MCKPASFCFCGRRFLVFGDCFALAPAAGRREARINPRTRPEKSERGHESAGRQECDDEALGGRSAGRK